MPRDSSTESSTSYGRPIPPRTLASMHGPGRKIEQWRKKSVSTIGVASNAPHGLLRLTWHGRDERHRSRPRRAFGTNPMASSGRAFEYRERHPRWLLRMLTLFLLVAAALVATVLLHRRFPEHDFWFLDIPVVGLVTYIGGRK